MNEDQHLLPETTDESLHLCLRKFIHEYVDNLDVNPSFYLKFIICALLKFRFVIKNSTKMCD